MLSHTRMDFENQLYALEDDTPLHVLTVAVKLPSGAIEVITNTQDIRTKLDYYLSKYDEEFRLEANPNVQIVGFMLL